MVLVRFCVDFFENVPHLCHGRSDMFGYPFLLWSKKHCLEFRQCKKINHIKRSKLQNYRRYFRQIVCFVLVMDDLENWDKKQINKHTKEGIKPMLCTILAVIVSFLLLGVLPTTKPTPLLD